MTNLHDHIKQQQEVNREALEKMVMHTMSDEPVLVAKYAQQKVHDITDETIKKTLAEVTHEWNKAEQKLNGTAQGAVNCIEYFRNFLTQLEESKR